MIASKKAVGRTKDVERLIEFEAILALRTRGHQRWRRQVRYFDPAPFPK